MRLNPGVFPLQTFITIETPQFNSVADILSLAVFNSKKYVTGFSYEDEFSKSIKSEVCLPCNCYHGLSLTGHFFYNRMVFFKLKLFRRVM